jgi:hypothetical protein
MLAIFFATSYQEVFQIQHLWLEDALLEPQPGSRVVVSMTTFSDRIIATGMHAIGSVIAQNKSFDRFIISMPLRPKRKPVESSGEMCAYFHDCIESVATHNSTDVDIISFLQARLGKFEKRQDRVYENLEHLITVQFLEEDYGPATKVLGALLIEKDPSTIIITVDDDITYERRLIQTLASHVPMDSALCPACQARSFRTGPKHIIHDASWHRWFWRYNGKQCPGWLLGWAGVAYRVGYFGTDVFNVSMPDECFYNDDVWLSGYLRRKGIGLIVMPGIKGGKHNRHPTLSISVRPDFESKDMGPCIDFWENHNRDPVH